MRKKICSLFYVLWMEFIFYMSHQPAKVSYVQSNKVVHVINKVSKSEENKNNINSFIVRKGAHMFLFCALGILLLEVFIMDVTYQNLYLEHYCYLFYMLVVMSTIKHLLLEEIENLMMF